MTMSEDDRDERIWERGFDGHAFEQQRRLARLSLREKIQWLEEAQRVAEHLARSRDRLAERPPGIDA